MELVEKGNIHLNQYPRGVSEYTDFDLLGYGSYGCVFKCKNIFDQKRYAIKNIVHKGKEKYAAEILNEFRTLSTFNHKNIIRYFTSWIEIVEKEDPKISLLKDTDMANLLTVHSKKKLSGYLVMECADLTLDQFIIAHYNSAIFDKKHTSIITQIACGIHYLHNLSPKCTHGDLTTNNILLVNDGCNFQVKIADFGLSKFLDGHQKQKQIDGSMFDTQELTSTLHDMCTSQDPPCRFDMYRFGIIIFQMVTLFTTGMHRSKLIEKFKQMKILTGIPGIDSLVSNNLAEVPDINLFCSVSHSYQDKIKLQFN
tara:strand:+ start:1386 stop:2318 length:933 start_codon:yes stop_codon:yes gene_type:complete